MNYPSKSIKRSRTYPRISFSADKLI